MQSIIRILPDSLANQIAAGEVIQRPASVVKELVENAIDAQATEITINIKDAGRTLIQVIDNGIGMNSDDARLAFERHATSKIKDTKDLFAINTKGFRGEALASIAAVARVELKTKPHGEELGTYIEIEASDIKKIEPVNTPAGSNFAVKNLFFNIPARRKFLKSDRTEFSHILTEFYRLVIPHHQIAFTLVHNGQIVYKLHPTSLKQRILNVFDNKFDKQLLTLSADGGFIKISGFVADPKYAVKTSPKQYFFVNNRFMKNAYFHKAVTMAYEKLIEPDAKPNYFIFFEIDPDKIDVNIHPTKTEINFDNANGIFQILLSVVRKTLTNFDIASAIDFENPDFFNAIHSPEPETVEPPEIKVKPDYNPFETVQKEIEFHSKISSQETFDFNEPFAEDNFSQNLSEEKSTSGFHKFIALKNKYIVTVVKSGLLIIDVKRAMQQIDYEDILNKLQKNSDAQSLLYPVKVTFSPDEIIFFDSIREKLENSGFRFEKIDNRSYNITASPPFVETDKIVTAIKNLVKLEQATDNEFENIDFRDIATELISTNQDVNLEAMSEKDLQNIVNRLFACESHQYTYDGKPIISQLSLDEIGKLF